MRPCNIISSLALFSLLCISYTVGQEECEVCVGVLTKVSQLLEKDEKSSTKDIETKFKEYCKTAKNKENRFCYYVGGTEDSATGILGEMSKPFSWGMPPNKVCEKLKKKDAQICDLKYDKQIDLSKVDLKKLKVRDLKKILSDWDEVCDDCLEKGDYVKYIESVKSKYVKTEL